MNLFTKQKDSQTSKLKLWYQRGKVGGGINWTFGIYIYTLLYLKEIKKKDLLNSTANSPQYSLTTYMGKEPKKDAFYNVLLLSAIQ